MPADERGASLGLVAVGIGASVAAGPAAGGLLVAAWGWPAIFIANLPLVALALVFAWRIPAPPLGPRPDVPLLAGLARSRTFVAANGSVALGNLAFYTTLIATPILLRDRFGWGSAAIGGAMCVLTAPSIVFGPLGGRIADRCGRRLPAVSGHALVAAGVVPLALPGCDRPNVLLPGLALAGIGFGLTIAPLQVSAIESVDVADAGAAAGLFSTSRYLGSMAGTLALSTLLVSDGATVEGVSSLGVVVAAAALFAALSSLALRGPSRMQLRRVTIRARV